MQQEERNGMRGRNEKEEGKMGRKMLEAKTSCRFHTSQFSISSSIKLNPFK
jgi:hypothetical protein